MTQSAGYNRPPAEVPPDDAQEKPCPGHLGCISVGYQYADIKIPIELKPDVTVGQIETECCGEPVAVCINNKSEKTCEIILTQKICIKIPVRYSTTACIGEAEADCHGCCGCK